MFLDRAKWTTKNKRGAFHMTLLCQKQRSCKNAHTHTHTRAHIEGLRTFSIIQRSQTDLTNGVCGHENLTRQNALDLDLDVHQPITDIFVFSLANEN